MPQTSATLEGIRPETSAEANPLARFRFKLLGNPMRIFLSYGCDEYASVALRIKRDLEALGHQVWFDPERVKPGGDRERYIEEGLAFASTDRNSGAFVLLMTPHSVGHPDGYCLSELARAYSRNLPIIQVMVSGVKQPLSICTSQYVYMWNHLYESEYEKGFRELVYALSAEQHGGFALVLPQKFAGYEIIGLIGWGRHGEVYKARNIDSDQLVALKVVDNRGWNPWVELREVGPWEFYGERLYHPNIVVIYHTGKVEEKLFCIMELVDGSPLDSVIRSDTRVPLSQAIDIIRQVSDALEFMHDRGLFHPDLKPSNILLLRNGNVKLGGFEIVWPPPEVQMGLGSICATLEYLSPELINGGMRDERSDVFALGCIFYELIEGRHPYKAANWPQTIRSIMDENERVTPSSRARDLQFDRLQKVLDKALERRMDMRYQSYSEFSRDLVQLKNDVDSSLL